MGLSLFLSKFKSLTPVVFVASSVLITIKLLTTQTPSLDNSINVALEEDIKTVSYEDEIVMPPEEKQEETEEEKAQEASEEADVPEEESTESDDEEDSKSESEEKKEKKEEKSKPRMFKEGDKMGILLKKLLTPPKK